MNMFACNLSELKSISTCDTKLHFYVSGTLDFPRISTQGLASGKLDFFLKGGWDILHRWFELRERISSMGCLKYLDESRLKFKTSEERKAMESLTYV